MRASIVSHATIAPNRRPGRRRREEATAPGLVPVAFARHSSLQFRAPRLSLRAIVLRLAAPAAEHPRLAVRVAVPAAARFADHEDDVAPETRALPQSIGSRPATVAPRHDVARHRHRSPVVKDKVQSFAADRRLGTRLGTEDVARVRHDPLLEAAAPTSDDRSPPRRRRFFSRRLRRFHRGTRGTSRLSRTVYPRCSTSARLSRGTASGCSRRTPEATVRRMGASTAPSK